jgi:hypothetical protein
VPITLYPEKYSKELKKDLVRQWEGKEGVPQELVNKIKQEVG